MQATSSTGLAPLALPPLIFALPISPPPHTVRIRPGLEYPYRSVIPAMRGQ